MALSQIQCLNDNHVNLRTHESKPEFLYCEDQRLALETLLSDGRDAFFKFLEARGLRGFLSDPELETLAGAVEPYDPGSELFPESAENDEPPLSLHYWPELSDTSIPQMDLGWPDSEAYRGVTRTTIYSQPPLEGQAHIKEVVRRMIAQAQKVIAVVMDVFTDVDIFRDLLDAGFKRKVSVYILLERTTLPHFLSMCQRANMHAGHLKHLRVRCTDGVEFYTRSSTKVRGQMGHRFMFIDGDKAVSGSYSFTWMSSRLERNLITVVTGQAVHAFDKLFRILYATSDSVDVRQVATEPEPELEPLPQLAIVAPLSAALARKLYSPKYALVTSGNHSPSPTPTAGHRSPEETQNPEDPETKKRRGSKVAMQEAPPLHPGLINLEKVCLIPYLPTWPEPDPPSDVIGFINIRDTSRPAQAHLQRSEMFETSQAIRFSSPFSMPQQTLPEVAKPRQLTSECEGMNILKPAQDKTKTLNTENKLHSNTPTDHDAGHNTTPHPNAHILESNSSQTAHPHGPTDGNSSAEQHTQTNTVLPHTGSHTQAVQPQNSSEVTPTANNHASSSSSSSGACSQSSTSSPFPLPPLTASSTTLNPPLPSSSASQSLTSTPPIPKPRTIQLVIKDGVTSQEPPEFSAVGRPETNTGPLEVDNEAENEPKTVPELQKNSGSKTGAQKDAENKGNIGEAPQQKQSGTSHETKNEEAVPLHDDRAGMQLVAETDIEAQSYVLITDAPKAEGVNIQEIIPKDVEPKTLTSIDCKLAPQINRAATVQMNGIGYKLRRISYCELALQDVGVLETVDSSEAPTHSPVSASPNSRTSKDTRTTAADTHGQRGNPSFTHMPDSLSPTSHRALVRTPTPDGFLPRVSTPDSRTHTPDSRSYTPDFRTPTPDGCVSPRDDSTTSEEYYECCDSPSHEPVVDRAAQRNHGTTEDHVSVTHTNTPNATTINSSPAYINDNTCAATLGTADRNTSSSETQSLSGPARVSSSSSLFEKKVKTGEQEEKTANEENGREVDEKGRELSVAERRTEGDSQGTERRGSEEAKRTAEHFKQGEDSTGAEEKNKEAQAPQRKRALNQSEAERPVDTVTPGELTNEGAEPKRLSTGDLKAKKVSSEGEKPDKEKAADQAALGPSGVERRDGPQSARETEGQKLLHTPPRPPQGQRQDSGPSRPLRPLTTSQPLGARPSGSRQQNQAESKVTQSRPAGAANSAAGQSHDDLLSRQPPTAQGRARAEQSLNQRLYPKPQASFLYTQANMQPQPQPQPQLHPRSQHQTVSVQEADRPEEGRAPFSFTFRRLYSLKGLRDKMSKLPAQSKRGSTSLPGHGRKSTS